MYKFLLPLALIATCSLKGQVSHLCGSTEATNHFFSQHPELRAQFEKQQQAAEAADAQASINFYARPMAAPAVTIPIVFHIIHTGGGENISDAQVVDAVNILNRDYRKQNPDTTAVVNPFKNIIGDANVEFVLAKKDPNGNCTNGIIRHYDTRTDWNSSDFSYYAYTWPRNKYLNIYVVKTINSGAAGYTFLPGTGIPAAADAIVILSNYVGSIGTGNVNLSRALTHEVGHWLNLQHVWGGNNNPGIQCGNDGVNDTPITKGFTSCALNNSDVCTPGTPENLQNYMDYSYCSRMFTNGQCTRMQAALTSTAGQRNNLGTPSNLAATGVTSQTTNCIPLLHIRPMPSNTICSGKSLALVSYTSNADVTTYAWSANNGAVIANPSAPGTNIMFANAGVTTVTCVASNANGSVSSTTVITVLNGVTHVTGNYSESFEAQSLPNNWDVINVNGGSITWEPTSLAGSEGSNSYYINGPANLGGQIDYLRTPSYDFANNPDHKFTFKYAYAKQSGTHEDIFKVQASSDCGGSWMDVYVPTAATMAGGSGGVTNVPFVPTAEQWKLYDLTEHPNFSGFLGLSNVYIRFSFQEAAAGNGNRIFLDEINFMGPVGVNEFTKSMGLKVYPNPAKDVFTIKFTSSDATVMKYEVTTITGAKAIAEKEFSFGAGSHEVNVNEAASLAPGIYFVNMEFNGVKTARKMIIE